MNDLTEDQALTLRNVVRSLKSARDAVADDTSHLVQGVEGDILDDIEDALTDLEVLLRDAGYGSYA